MFFTYFHNPDGSVFEDMAEVIQRVREAFPDFVSTPGGYVFSSEENEIATQHVFRHHLPKLPAGVSFLAPVDLSRDFRWAENNPALYQLLENVKSRFN